MMSTFDTIHSELTETRNKIRNLTAFLEQRRTKITEPPTETFWEPVPPSDYERLQRNLQRIMKMKKTERIALTQNVLKEQNNLCALGIKIGGKYCRNPTRYINSDFLHLQWICVSDKPILVCSCCSGYIKQTTSLTALYSELRSKQDHVLKLL